MTFYVTPQVWGVLMEADEEAARWLIDFLRRKAKSNRTAAADREAANDLRKKLEKAIG